MPTTLATLRRSPAWQQAASVAVATGAYGISFGALAVAAGLDLWQTAALSVLMFTGGSQFAFIGLVGSVGALPAAVASAALLGVRNFFYGVAVAPFMRYGGAGKRLWRAHMTIDESTAVSLAQPAADVPERRRGFWWTGVGIFVLWNAMTLMGAVAGQAIGDPATWGLDAAAAAAFLALVWPRLNSRAAWGLALAGAAVALALTPVAPAGMPILVAAAVAIVAGWPAPRDGGDAPDAEAVAP